MTAVRAAPHQQSGVAHHEFPPALDEREGERVGRRDADPAGENQQRAFLHAKARRQQEGGGAQGIRQPLDHDRVQDGRAVATGGGL